MKKYEKIILTTSNSNKKREIQEILNIPLLMPKDFGVNIKIVEDGKDFFSNSYKKAYSTYQYFVKNNLYEKDQAFLSDDSGICIKALNLEPGIYSARYLDEKLSPEERNQEILKKLENKKDRYAYFVCAAVLLYSENDFISASAILEGQINEKSIGNEGFAYDKIFYLKEYKKTLSQLGSKVKNQISHRSKAFLKIKKFIKNN